jgi:hypothetical protein
MTAVRIVRALTKYLRLRLRGCRSRRPTVCVRPTPVTVRRAPLVELLSIAKLLVNKFVLADSCKRKAESTENTWLSGGNRGAIVDEYLWEKIAELKKKVEFYFKNFSDLRYTT